MTVMMPSMETETETLKPIPISETGNHRRRPLRSRTYDTLVHILSFCHTHIIQNPDKGTENGLPSECDDIIHNDLFFQEQMPMDETQAVFDAQEGGGVCDKHMESAEHGHNLLGEKKDLSHKVNISPSVNFDIKSQDNYDMISSCPHLPTDKDIEGLEILEDLMDFMPGVATKSLGKTDSEPKDFIGTEPGLQNDNSLTESVEKGGKDMAGAVNKTTRNLVDYSEIDFDSEFVLPRQNNSKFNTKNQDLVYLMKDISAQNNKRRPRSCTKEERRNKKSKNSVYSITCAENQASLGVQHAGVSQEAIDASANDVDVGIEKKRKQVLTKERKAKKKMKERIKQAEKNKKLGIRRLKLQPVIKEKKISYCRHYMKGRCHEGGKCKFSHDTIPLTKSTPCCHFARHACMKGDDCPYDHDLSKYPCNNYQTKGSCNRGSDCMFSHQAQPSEALITASNESKPEQKPPSNSGSKLVEAKPCPVPKFADITPKSARPPKGINFLSQEKLPLVSCEVKKVTNTSPVIQDSKETTKTSPVAQDSKEITKVQPAVPRGINFLSFGKKPDLDHSNGGFSFKISNRTEKPGLSDVESEAVKSNSTVKVIDKVKVDSPTDRPSSSKNAMPMMSFMPSTSQKVLHSTLAFASKFDSGVKSKV